ncbi:hypothetical protein TNCV_1680031 [Trichonephila clavipes]|nr:hypothetical protein TNCV_1680031 [Trichonephila clavipes]
MVNFRPRTPPFPLEKFLCALLSVAGTRAYNCISCNLLRMVWADTNLPVSGGNRLRMSRVEKGSRIVTVDTSSLCTVGSLMVRASDSKPEDLGSMPVPPNSLRVHKEYVLIKSVGPKVLWAESHECRELEKISLHFSSMPKLWR